MSDSMDTSIVSAGAQQPALHDSADSGAEVAPGGDGGASGNVEPIQMHPAMAVFEQVVENHRVIADATKSNESLIKALQKEMKKVCKKRRKPSGTPSNLMKPIPLSDDLCDFLSQDRGAKLPRGQVTSKVNNYAIKNKLKKEGNGRIIVVDRPLAKLLGLSVGDEVTIFQVPTHLKNQNHYVKEEPTPA
eukprot:jgi/Tetstr1/464037/TSEL_008842.t1